MLSKENQTEEVVCMSEIPLKEIEHYCKVDRQAIEAMSATARNLTWECPPESAWNELKQRKKNIRGLARYKPKKDMWKVFSSLAAGIFLVLISGVLYQQNRMQVELQEIRLASQLVEEQLLNNLSDIDMTDDLLHQVLMSEQAMESAASEHEVVNLLKNRQQLMRLMIEQKILEERNEVISL